MTQRLTFLLAGALLTGCAATQPVDQTQPTVVEPVAATLETRSSVPTVDEHLYEPARPRPQPVATPEPHVHPSVWERLTHSFALPDCAAHEVSRDWTEWYASRPEYMGRIFKRAEPWIHFIADELERRGMPGELALLPIVESAYDPFAYSHGHAMGMWQFISATGRRYGLDQNWWYDGRRDVWASTHAALDYLADLHAMFDGDWLLALAAYNSGEGRVGRQVKRNLASGKPGDFWNLKLPRETRGYVPKLLGLACLFADPARYEFEIPATPDEPVIAGIDAGQQVDLVLVSQISEVPIDVLFTLNPGYNRWATSPQGPHRVVLPLEAAERFEGHLAALDGEALMKWDQVVVEPGDTLSHLASRHRVPVSVIRTSNDIDGDLIRPGQKLRLPRDEQLLIDPLYASAAAELAQLQSGLIAADRIEHRVRRGETLSVIARRYDVSVKDLMRWNGIKDPRRLRAGKTLTVFHHAAPAPSQRSGSVVHTVQRGDSLWSISRKYNVALKDLMRWNEMSGDTVLQPGQSLRINL